MRTENAFFASKLTMNPCRQSKFMRNPPPPPSVCDGTKFEDLQGTDTPVWIDMVPITFRPIGSIESYLVDFGKKNME